MAIVVSLLLLSLCFLTRFDFKGHHEGLFLLKGKGWRLFELKDDLYLGDGSRILLHFDTDRIRDLYSRRERHPHGRAYLEYVWDAADGSGYVVNVFPGGERLMTNFSRFIDEDGKAVFGLFVGGGLPLSVLPESVNRGNDTGMAWFDGTRWFHVWCNVNEGIGPSGSPGAIPPSRWKFLGSRILNYSDKRLVLSSWHEIEVEGVPLRIDRYAYFTAGDPFFRLEIRITNIGRRSVRVAYNYGDDPWLGDFGRGKGNVGWVKDRLIRHEELVDSSAYSWAGMYDRGNETAGDPPGMAYTYIANFIEWLGPDKPVVYYANTFRGPQMPILGNVPLSSNERFIGLQWDPLELDPGKGKKLFLVVGKANTAPDGGLPSIPPGALDALPSVPIPVR